MGWKKQLMYRWLQLNGANPCTFTITDENKERTIEIVLNPYGSAPYGSSKIYRED